MDPEPRRLTLAQALDEARERVRQRIRQDRDRVERPDLKRLLDHLALHVFDDDLSLSRLRKSKLFPDATWTAFTRTLGVKPAAYKLHRKLEGAEWLLRRTNASVFYIADFAGYSRLAAFDNAFGRGAGMSPTDYRKARQGDDVIEIVADEMETDELWWKAILGLLSLDQAKRLFTRMAESFPFLDPCRKAPRWTLRARGHDKAELIPHFEAVWHEIRQLPREAQLAAVRDRIETDTADFFHFLCEKSLVEGREAPNRGVEVMELARVHLRANAEHLGTEADGLEVLGLARFGNAQIAASRFADACRDVDAALRAWNSVHFKVGWIEPEIMVYKTRLLILQGRHKEAQRFLGHAMSICKDSPRLLAVCLIQRSTIARYQDRLKEAILDLYAARDVLGHQNEPRLVLAVYSNLALFHALADELADAEPHLVQAKALCHALADRVIRQHLHWTEALIWIGRGDLEAAAIELEDARTGFNSVDQPGYAAMASLELAMIRLEQGRFGEVVKLAAEAIPVLEHFRHATGAAAALALLREGLATHRLTRHALKQARTALHALWRDPSLDLGAFKGGDGPG